MLQGRRVRGQGGGREGGRGQSALRLEDARLDEHVRHLGVPVPVRGGTVIILLLLLITILFLLD